MFAQSSWQGAIVSADFGPGVRCLQARSCFSHALGIVCSHRGLGVLGVSSYKRVYKTLQNLSGQRTANLGFIHDQTKDGEELHLLVQPLDQCTGRCAKQKLYIPVHPFAQKSVEKGTQDQPTFSSS